jgi:uncharacterized protein YbaR (Trm112 family)
MLKLKLKEVVGMNVGWQHLHEEQEKRIAGMTEQIRQLQQTIALSSAATEATSAESQSPKPNADACSASVNAFDDGDMESLKRKCSQLESEKLELETRVGSLQAQLESTHDIVRQLEQAVDQLNCNLETVAKEKQSFIDMLQAQILVYREDFECERYDRERAQGKLIELKTELEYLRQGLINENPLERRTRTESSRPAMYVTAPQPVAVANIYANPGDYAMTGTSASGARRQNIAYNYYNYGLLMHGRDEPDCDSAPKKDAAVELSDSATAVNAEVITGDTLDNVDDGKKASPEDNGGYEVDSAPAEDVLRCPNCRRRFTIDEHVDLMDHMEICDH